MRNFYSREKGSEKVRHFGQEMSEAIRKGMIFGAVFMTAIISFFVPASVTQSFWEFVDKLSVTTTDFSLWANNLGSAFLEFNKALFGYLSNSVGLFVLSFLIPAIAMSLFFMVRFARQEHLR